MAAIIVTLITLVLIPVGAIFAGADSARPNTRNWA
jgi:hypothetical protein